MFRRPLTDTIVPIHLKGNMRHGNAQWNRADAGILNSMADLQAPRCLQITASF